MNENMNKMLMSHESALTTGDRAYSSCSEKTRETKTFFALFALRKSTVP